MKWKRNQTMSPAPAMESLPDYLRPGLAILSIGLNPSVLSARKGFYFAHPRNRFWRALNAAGLADEVLEPGRPAVDRLFACYGIGFTDLVKRPTPGLGDLSAEDFRKGAPLLKEKITRYQPRIAWFHGKETYRNYLRHAEGLRVEFVLGLQDLRIGNSRVLVAPSPSPANAAVSLEDLVEWYRRLKALRNGGDPPSGQH